MQNLPAVQETWVQSLLGRSTGEGKDYLLQYSGLENSMDSPWGHKESDRTERLSLSLPQTAWFERYTNYIAPGLPWWLRW